MANATLTSGTLSPARSLVKGIYAQKFNFGYDGVSISVSNQILVGYVQPNSVVLDCWIWGADGSSGTSTFKIGTMASDTFISGATAVTLSSAGVIRPVTFLPKTLSVSDDAVPYAVPITITKTVGTSTITGSLNLMLLLMSPPL